MYINFLTFSSIFRVLLSTCSSNRSLIASCRRFKRFFEGAVDELVCTIGGEESISDF